MKFGFGLEQMTKLQALLVGGSAIIAAAAMGATSANAWGTQQGYQTQAKPVACYKKVHQPAQYKLVKQHVLVQHESSRVETIPARYEIRKRKVLISPQQVHYRENPAKYNTEVCAAGSNRSIAPCRE